MEYHEKQSKQSMLAISGQRLVLEWKAWVNDHPAGFKAQPSKNPNGNLNLRQWECSIPGPKSTLWEGGSYNLIMTFPDDFPTAAPICQFQPPLFHPNVFLSGEIFLPELCEDMCWCPDLNIERILLLIQDMFKNPNAFEMAHTETTKMYLNDYNEFERIVRHQVKSLGEDEQTND